MMNDDLRFARYLRDRGQVVLAKDLVLESLVSSSDVGWLEVAIVGDDVENLSALCAAIVGGPFYGIARSLGEALGRLRQLPRLGPILDGENIDVAAQAIVGALNAIAFRREPDDASAVEEILLPPLRRFKADALIATVAAALAALGNTTGATRLVAELSQKFESLDSQDRASLQAALAPALVLLGEFERATAFLDDAERRFVSVFGDDDVDGYGVPSFDALAFDRARATHLKTWTRGSWEPIRPVSSRFSSQLFRFGRGRSLYEARKNAIEHHVEASVLGKADAACIEAAMTVIEDSRDDEERNLGSLVRLLERWSRPLPDQVLHRLRTVLAASTPDEAADGAWTLAWLGHVMDATEVCGRVKNEYLRRQITTQMALSLATREDSREEAIRLAKEVAHVDDGKTSPLASRLLRSLNG